MIGLGSMLVQAYCRVIPIILFKYNNYILCKLFKCCLPDSLINVN